MKTELVADKYRFFVGIDWGVDAHVVCVLDSRRKVLLQRSVEHTGTAILALADDLAKLGDVREMAVAVEMPRGSVIETLIERGLAVFHINPKQSERFRDRHSPAGAKDDRRDAFVLADALRTDLHCFHQVVLGDALIVELRELVRVDDDLAADMNRGTNRLREQVHRYFPQFLKLSPSMDEVWAWEMLTLIRTPAGAVKVTVAKVAGVLKKNRIRRVAADEVLAILREKPLHVAPGTAQAAWAHIELLLPRLELVRAQRRQLDRRIDALLERLPAAAPAATTEGSTEEPGEPSGQKYEHRDAQLLLSLPGVGNKVAATMLVEATQALAERNYQALRALAGIAPVTSQSGKRRSVAMRQACNNRLRNACYHWANVSMQREPRAKAAYATLRARGHSHGRALRSIADQNLRMLMAMLRAGTPFDPARRVPRQEAARAAT
ncbi:MAG: IS110 family transposase [Pseudomonadota bacterium]|nr:IS110 family transposase [Pseudomonadota bacterium]